MALGLCDRHDPAPRALHHHPRLAEEGAYDGPCVSPSYCPHWRLLQLELDLR